MNILNCCFSVITGSFLETGCTWSYFKVAHFVRNVLWNSGTALSFVGLFGSKLVALWGCQSRSFMVLVKRFT